MGEVVNVRFGKPAPKVHDEPYIQSGVRPRALRQLDDGANLDVNFRIDTAPSAVEEDDKPFDFASAPQRSMAEATGGVVKDEDLKK